MTDLTPNHDLFIDVLAQIEKDPQSWNQNWWAESGPDCGTTFCFAGHTVLAAGYTLKWSTFGNEAFASCVETDEGTQFIQDVALELLGLDYPQSLQLFGTPTDREKLYEVCAEILGLDTQVLKDKVKG